MRKAFDHYYGRGRALSEVAIRRRARAWGPYQNLAVHYLLAGMRLREPPRRRGSMNKKLSIPILGQGDPNAPKDVHLVGRYALGVDWTDGHGSIYPFEHLRRACPCGACADLAAGAGDGDLAPGDQEARRRALRVGWADAPRERLCPTPTCGRSAAAPAAPAAIDGRASPSA